MSDDQRTNLVALLNALAEALSPREAERSIPVQSQPPAITDADGPALISVPEAARVLGLSRASAYRYANAGKLPVKRFGRRVYVVRALLRDVVVPDATPQEVDAA